MLISADDARKALRSNLNLKMNNELDDIDTRILTAIAGGLREVDISGELLAETLEAVRHLGYETQRYDFTDSRDNYNEYGWTIKF